jgi:peroxiredoxin Q/BCP
MGHSGFSGRFPAPGFVIVAGGNSVRIGREVPTEPTFMLKPGETAPRFELPDADMEMVSLDAFLGKHNVVLFFYPKDDSPACILEAIGFSDLDDEFRSAGAAVLGVSMDDCLSHGAFRDKHGLAVQLLSDDDGEVCARYGVLHDKELEGRRRRCVQRSTFIIGRDGRVVSAQYGVTARGHAAEVLNLVKGMA